MVEQTPGVTRLIDRLEGKHLVVRCRGEDDRRQVLCRLTAAGYNLLSQLDTAMEEAAEAGVAMLRPEDQLRLLEMLATIRAGHR